jgi:transcriptional regulator with XRE-family HTH domain
VNIRTLRQRKGWSQAKLGELMGWQNASTVCAAEGRRDGRQRGFTVWEIERLAAIFGVSPDSSRRSARTVTASRRWGSLPGMRNRDRDFEQILYRPNAPFTQARSKDQLDSARRTSD